MSLGSLGSFKCNDVQYQLSVQVTAVSFTDLNTGLAAIFGALARLNRESQAFNTKAQINVEFSYLHSSRRQ